MSIFTSQFDRTRPFTRAYASSPDDPGWRTPAAVAAVAGAGLAGVVAVEALAADSPDAPAAWGDGWDTGWDTGGDPFAGGVTDYAAAGGDPWMDRGEYTGAGVGGDDDFFYFVDGDSSLAIG